MPKKPYIDILLPYKELFTPYNAGAVSTVVSDFAYHTTLEYEIYIYGRNIPSNTFSNLSYIPLKPNFPLLLGHNIGLAHSYIAHLKRRKNLPSLIEVHGRCKVARTIAKKCKKLKVALFLHNDPREMIGGRTLEERLWLAKNLSGIFNTDWSTKKFN